MSAAKMPQRWDLVGEYDGYMSPIEEGDYVKVEDVQPLLAELERLRARVEVLERVRENAKAAITAVGVETEQLRAQNERLRARVEVLEGLARESLNALTFDQNGPHRNALRDALKEAKP